MPNAQMDYASNLGGTSSGTLSIVPEPTFSAKMEIEALIACTGSVPLPEVRNVSPDTTICIRH
jgi:hypothetical protein